MLDVNGSPEYVLTWKHWDMSAGEPICALRASGRHTSGNGCSGVPTPTVQDSEQAGGKGCIQKGNRGHSLHTATILFGPTQSGGHAATESSEEFRPDGFDTPRGTGGGNISRGHDRKNELLLAGQAKACGWATLTTTDAIKGGNVSPRPGMMGLSEQVPLAGYPTLNCEDGKQDNWTDKAYIDAIQNGRTPPTTSQRLRSIAQMSNLAGYPTATGDDANNVTRESGAFQSLTRTALLHLPNMQGWRLNPLFSLWLMGFPPIWFKCACRMVGKSIGKHSPWLKHVPDEQPSSKAQETR